MKWFNAHLSPEDKDTLLRMPRITRNFTAQSRQMTFTKDEDQQHYLLAFCELTPSQK